VRQFASAFAWATLIGCPTTVPLGEEGDAAGLTWFPGVASAFTDWVFVPKVVDAAVTLRPPGPELT
jgi:hypothetical protein